MAGWITESETVPSVADRFAHIRSAINAVQEMLQGISEGTLKHDEISFDSLSF